MNWKALSLIAALSLTATLAACGKPAETAAPDAMSPAGDAMSSPAGDAMSPAGDAMKSPAGDAMASPSPATAP